MRDNVSRTASHRIASHRTKLRRVFRTFVYIYMERKKRKKNEKEETVCAKENIIYIPSSTTNDNPFAF